ncbi:MAG TPA: hypothetical protein VEQ37_14560 [Actinomycetota bacterium]|nr:hypothetical protein [Actinomycetota bacterium]
MAPESAKRHRGGHPWTFWLTLLALLLAIVGVITSYLRGRKSAVLGAAAGATAAGSLIGAATTFKPVDLGDRLEFGLYVALAALATATLIHGSGY